MLAGDEHVGVRRSDARDRLQDRLHGWRGRNEFGTALGAQQPGLGFQLLRTLQRTMELNLSVQNRQQALVLPRLLDEVARATSHGFNCERYIAPRGHDDYRQAAVEGDNLREQIEAFLTRRRVAR